MMVFADKKFFALTAATALAFTSCDKGGGSFSVLSESSVQNIENIFVPRKLDVLFIVDNSGSMYDEQTALANNFGAFIDNFMEKKFDFQIAVGTTENYAQTCPNFWNGTGNPESARILKVKTVSNSDGYDINSEDPATKAAERLALKAHFTKSVTTVGINGNGIERGLESARKLLEVNSGGNAVATGCTTQSHFGANSFHRPDAYLAVVIVSDEDESISQTKEQIRDTNINYFNSKYGTAGSDYSISAIVTWDDCGTGTKGTKYDFVAQAAHGTRTSICGDFSNSLKNISENIAAQNKAEFFLNKKPIVESIRVIINGNNLVPQSETDGWSYRELSNPTRYVVNINGATYAPQSGDSVRINFDPDVGFGQ